MISDNEQEKTGSNERKVITHVEPSGEERVNELQSQRREFTLGGSMESNVVNSQVVIAEPEVQHGVIPLEKEKDDSNQDISTSTAKKRKHQTFEEEQAILGELERNLKVPLESIYVKCVNKEDNWKEEFIDFCSHYLKIQEDQASTDILPSSVNEEGSYVLSLSYFWVLYIHFRLAVLSDSERKQSEFLEIMNNATLYPIEHKLLLVEHFIKCVEELFTKEEIVRIINQNPKLTDKRRSVFEVSKDDYKYLIEDPDFFSILVPRPLFAGKKQKQSVESERSPERVSYSRRSVNNSNTSNKKSNQKSNANQADTPITGSKNSSPLNSAGKQKFQADIEYPKELDHEQVKEELSFHHYQHIHPDIEPILEEKVEEETEEISQIIQNNTNNNIPNNHYFPNSTPGKNNAVITNTPYSNKTRPSIKQLKQEIIASTVLTVDRTEMTLPATRRDKQVNNFTTTVRSHSFTLYPNKKRLSFVNNFEETNLNSNSKSNKKERNDNSNNPSKKSKNITPLRKSTDSNSNVNINAEKSAKRKAEAEEGSEEEDETKVLARDRKRVAKSQGAQNKTKGKKGKENKKKTKSKK